MCLSSAQTLVCAAVLLAFTAGQSLAAGIHSNAGTTALNFLKTAVGARPAALASAYTALSDDATACFWNPAGLTDAQAHEVFLTHHRFIADISQSAAAYIFEVRRVKVGLSMNYFGMGEMERREVNSVNPEGVFSPFDLALGVSAAYRVTELVSAGVTARWVHEDLDSETAGMMLYDFGIKSNTVIPGLTAAISIRNLGGRLEFESQGYEAPREIAVGAAWRKGLPWADGSALLTAEIVSPRDNDTRIALGAEYGFRDFIFGRAGWRSGLLNEDVSFGFGFNYLKMRFDYAFVPYISGLGDSHRFSFNYWF